MSKVLVLANDASGLYDFRKDLISKFVSLGHKVYASIPATEYVEQLEGIGCKIIDTPVDRRGINPVKDLKLIFEYIKIVSKVKPDVAITYTIKPNIYGAIACMLKKTSYACNITGLGTAFQNDGLLKKFVTALYKIALRKVKVVYFENCENMQIFIDSKIVKQEQCKLLNGAGVNLEEFSFMDYPQESETTKFLFMGRIMAEKGVNELFDACHKLYENGYKFNLDVLGSYEEDYKEIIDNYINEGWLKFHGYQNDVRPFIRDCNCFVLPSWHEGMANTNLECGAMGRPIITSNIHGCLEAVIDGETGFLAEPKNADDLYSKMKTFIDLPYDKKVEMGQASHNHIAGKFDKKDVVSKTIERIFS